MYYRTDRTIAIRGQAGTEVEVRTFTEAASETEARALSRADALAAVHPDQEKEVLGLETVVSVPGVTSPRPPEVRVNGQWRPVGLHE
jgi:hypothetical protein